MQRGPLVGKIFELVKETMTIGRDVQNDIVINDAEVSRQHVRFSKQGNGYSIEDLGSTNGTFVNSMRLAGQKALTSGDVIALGETVVFEYVALSADMAATIVGGMSPAITPADMPEVASAPPPVIPAATTRDPGPAIPSVPTYQPDSTPAASGPDRRMLYAGIGCVVLLCCCLALAAVAVWFAPAEFWSSLGF
jgi:predicted component of type VI protein secretion system